MLDANLAEKKAGKLKSLFYLFVIPLLFTLIMTGVIMSFLGYPVVKTMGQWGSHIPVVKNWLPGADKAKENAKDATSTGVGGNSGKSSNGGTATADQSKNDQASQASQLPSPEQKQIEDLKKQNEDLQKQLAQKNEQQEQDKIQQEASLYATMSSSKAATIIEAMPLDQAAYIMSGLAADQQSSVLGSFKDPKKAANVTTLIGEIGVGKDRQSIQDMASSLESPSSTLTQTISAMPAAQSAQIIQNLMAINQKDALEVMKNMNTATRSQVLTEITNSNPKLAAVISSNLTK